MEQQTFQTPVTTQVPETPKEFDALASEELVAELAAEIQCQDRALKSRQQQQNNGQ